LTPIKIDEIDEISPNPSGVEESGHERGDENARGDTMRGEMLQSGKMVSPI